MSIAIDSQSSVFSTTGTSLTFAHTCSGDNRILFVNYHSSTTADYVTGITYNGTSMTKVAGTQVKGDHYIGTYYLINPDSGSHNVVISAGSSDSIRAHAISYTGVKQDNSTYSIDLEKDSSQYLSITDANQTGLDITGDLTIEAWVKFETAGTNQLPIISKWNADNNRSYYFDYYNNTLRLGLSDDGTSVINQTVSWTPSIGVWYHLAVSYDLSAGSSKFYVDGSQQGSTQTGGKTSIFNSNADFIIGRAATTSGQYFDGKIDDVRIWNDIRTATEIKENNKRELTGSESNLQGYWKFENSLSDETSNNNDLTNNNSASFSSNTPSLPIDSYNTGEEANTYSFDFERDNSRYLSITDANQTGLDLTSDLTFEAWIKFESLSTSEHRPIIAKSGSSSNRGYRFYVYLNSELRLYISPDGTNYEEYSVSWSPSTDTWYHVAVSWDASASEAKFYVDGSQQGTTQTGSYTGIKDQSEPFQIGRLTTTSGEYFDGKMDEVRVWDDVRTATEISDNYGKRISSSSSNLQGYWQLDNDLTDETSNSNDLSSSGGSVFSTDIPPSDNISINTTTLLDNCWTTMFLKDDQGSQTYSGETMRLNTDSGGHAVCDSNGVITPAGSTSLSVSSSDMAYHAGIIVSFAPTSSSNYSLTASVGSFILTGKDVVIYYGKILTAGAGSFALTGVSSGMSIARKLIASVGSFSLLGKTIILTKNITASVVSFMKPKVSKINNKDKPKNI